MLLGSEYGLVLVIKPDTNALSPPDDIYCLLRGPTTHPGLPALPQPIPFAPATLCLSTITSCPKLVVAELVYFTHPAIISSREHSALKVGDV